MSVIQGSGGGGGKSGSGGSGRESPNTLRSTTKARIVELLGEGPIVGLVLEDGTPIDDTNGGRAIFLDQTPIQNNDNTANFRGVTWGQRFGLPDQDFIRGFNQVETPFSVEQQVKASLSPIVRTITDENVNSVRVVARMPALAHQIKSTGDIKGASVEYAIDVRVSGGEFVQVDGADIKDQKCTSEYRRAHRIELPAGGAPWDIRFRRITEDSEVVELQNETWWESYTEVIEGKFIYPDSALVALEIDAQQFGSSIAARSFRVKGLITDVPSNYDPVTRTYTGIWDGTFKKAWHNNPVWVTWDLLMNNRYGLGEFINPAIVDKWGFYTISQYCDGLVPTGYKNAEGEDILEPRFTFNGVINSRKEAFKVLQDITAAFRGMAYWSLGQIFISADMPQDPITTIAPANVIDGKFRYSGTGLKARHSVAMVSWNDPNDFGRPAIEVVQNDVMLRRYGWRQIEVQMPGCNSRGMARRFGKWILDTEQNETESVSFTMSWDGYVRENGGTLQPGNIVLIADPKKTGKVRIGGRLKQVNSASEVVLDAPFEPIEGETYKINVCLPNASMEVIDIVEFTGGNTIVTLAEDASTLPEAGALWSITGTDLAPRPYRIMTIKEEDDHLFSITALFNDPTKYARVEQDITLAPIRYTRPRDTVAPPTGLSAVESTYFQNGTTHSRVTLSWSPPSDFLAAEYTVTADTPRGFRALGSISTPSIDVEDPVAGTWTFYVSSRSRAGKVSTPVSFQFDVEGWEGVAGPTVVELALVGGDDATTFNTPAATIEWSNQFPDDAVLFNPENVIRVYNGEDTLLGVYTQRHTGFTFSFEENENLGGPFRTLKFGVTVKDATGNETAPTFITVENPVPTAITPEVTAGPGSISINYTPTDADFAGIRVWISAEAGFDPVSVPPIYDMPGTSVLHVVASGTWYVKAAAYDVFGKTGLNVGPQQAIAVSSVADMIDEVADEVADALSNIGDAVSFDDLDGVAAALNDIIGQIMVERDANSNTFNRYRNVVSVGFENANALIAQETLARVTATEAEATARLALQATLEGDIGDVSALVEAEQTARVDADSALALDLTTLTTRVGDSEAAIDVHTASINGVQVQFGVTGTINEMTGGFLFQGITKLDGSVDFTLQIDADVLVDGSITAAKIAAETITGDNIAAGTLTTGHLAAHTIVAANMAAGSITATEIDVETLDAVSGDMGLLTAGRILLGDSDGMIDIDGSYPRILISDDT